MIECSGGLRALDRRFSNLAFLTEQKGAGSMKLENDLGNDPILRLVFRIAIPSMLGQFVSVLYSIVDRMYIGNIPQIGDLALAGVGVCGPILTMIGSVAFWVGVGGAPLMSMRMGEQNNEAAKKNAFCC